MYFYIDFYRTLVRLGEWDLAGDPDCEELVANKLCADSVEMIPIKETIAHPFFSRRTAHNDIAMIRLARKVQFTGKRFVTNTIILPTNAV